MVVWVIQEAALSFIGDQLIHAFGMWQRIHDTSNAMTISTIETSGELDDPGSIQVFATVAIRVMLSDSRQPNTIQRDPIWMFAWQIVEHMIVALQVLQIGLVAPKTHQSVWKVTTFQRVIGLREILFGETVSTCARLVHHYLSGIPVSKHRHQF